MGTQVFGGLGPGLGGTINPFDKDYEDKLLAQRQQQIADKANADAIFLYTSRALQLKKNNALYLIDKQPLQTLDPPPHKKVVSPDLGHMIVDSTDLVCAPISVVPDPVESGQGDKGLPQGQMMASTTPAADRIDQIIAMLRVIYSEIHK